MKYCLYAAAMIAFLAFMAMPLSVLAEEQATISLGTDPEPPDCVQNPGGITTIFWNIQHATTPDHVNYTLFNPTHTITIESQVYPGSTGIDIIRTWTVPSGMVPGMYWVRIEYYAVGIGLEAWAEVGFLVCQPTGSICADKWLDADCDGLLSQVDTPLSSWLVCLINAAGDTLCLRTDEHGQACYNGLPYGEYTVFEALAEGYLPIYPTSYPVTLSDGPVHVVFFNVAYDQCYGACCLPGGECSEVKEADCATAGGEFMGLGTHCAEVDCLPTPPDGSTWGRLKSLFR